MHIFTQFYTTNDETLRHFFLFNQCSGTRLVYGYHAMDIPWCLYKYLGVGTY